MLNLCRESKGFVTFMVNKAAFIDYQLIPKFWLDYFDMDIEY